MVVAVRHESEAIGRSTDLHALEGIVRKGLRAVQDAVQEALDAAEALHRIHEAKLWRLTHSTWGSYCQYLGTTPQRAHQIMTWVRINRVVDTPVPNERAARELAKLPPDERGPAMREAADEAGGSPSGEDVRRVVGRKLEVISPQLPGMPPKVVETKVRKSTQNRRTPQWLFDVLNEMFGPFVLDAYSDHDNALCERHYTIEEDGNVQPWADVTFANPEFRDMCPVLEQALRQAELGVRSIILGPTGCSQEWFHDLAIQGTVFVPDCRINYDDPEGNPTGHGLDEPGADRDTMVFAFGPGFENPRAGEGVFLARRLLIKGRRP